MCVGFVLYAGTKKMKILLLFLFFIVVKSDYTLTVDLENSLPGSTDTEITILNDGTTSKNLHFIGESDTDVQELLDAVIMVRHKLNKVGESRFASGTFLSGTPIDAYSAHMVAEYSVTKNFHYGNWYLGWVIDTDFILIFNFTLVKIETVEFAIDLQRNLLGSTEDTIVAIKDESNNLYLISTGVAAIYSNYSVSAVDENDVELLGSHTLLPFTSINNVVILRLTLDLVLTEHFGINISLTANASDIATVFVFQLGQQQDLTLISCINDALRLKIPVDRNQTRLAVIGQETNPECNFVMTLDETKEISMPMSACGLSYDVEFVLRFTSVFGFQGINDDINIRLECNRIVDIFVMSNNQLTGRYVVDGGAEINHQHQLQAAMFLYERGDTLETPISGNVAVKTQVTLKIELDFLFRNVYDITPVLCTANGQIILDNGCATYPFANFTRENTGIYRSEFDMFRTVTNGFSDSDVIFNCIMYICQSGDCGSLPCIN